MTDTLDSMPNSELRVKSIEAATVLEDLANKLEPDSPAEASVYRVTAYIMRQLVSRVPVTSPLRVIK